MKKIIGIIFALFIGFAVYAQDSSVWVEGGWLPNASEVKYPEGFYSELFLKNVCYIDIGLNYSFLEHLYVGGVVRTYILPDNGEVGFLPFYTFYTFDTGIKLEGLTIGYEHRCTHSVNALGYLFDPLFPADSGYDKIFVKFEIKF